MFNRLKLRNIALFMAMASGTICAAQEYKITDNEVKKLINRKVNMDKKVAFKDRYTIQIYYGDMKSANKMETRYKESGLHWTSQQYYEAPNFKVWIGSYPNKRMAEKALNDIKRDFPHAFVLKP